MYLIHQKIFGRFMRKNKRKRIPPQVANSRTRSKKERKNTIILPVDDSGIRRTSILDE